MKITTNSFGNYKPQITQTKNNISQLNAKNKIEAPKITSEEKKFFTKMYPEDSEQINNYHFYHKDGSKIGVSLGSLFDKRG